MANFGDGNIADWRAKLVEENARVKEALKAAQARRKSQYFRELQETGEKKDEGEEQEQEQQQQQQEQQHQAQTSRTSALKEQIEKEDISVEVNKAHLAYLELAEKEFARANKRYDELEKEIEEKPFQPPTSTATEEDTEAIQQQQQEKEEAVGEKEKEKEKEQEKVETQKNLENNEEKKKTEENEHTRVPPITQTEEMMKLAEAKWALLAEIASSRASTGSSDGSEQIETPTTASSHTSSVSTILEFPKSGEEQKSSLVDQVSTEVKEETKTPQPSTTETTETTSTTVATTTTTTSASALSTKEEEEVTKTTNKADELNDKATNEPNKSEKAGTPTVATTTTTNSENSNQSGVGEFVKPQPHKVVQKKNLTYETILKEIQVPSSPLVFFNLACFYDSQELDAQVSQPICGYALAGHMLAVMGPEGTESYVLKDALSESTAHAVEFTVSELIDVADSILRPPNFPPNAPLIKLLKLDSVANVLIGTCIQKDFTPDPTQKSETPQTPRFSSSRVSLHKSVILIKDITTTMEAEPCFRVLKALKKITAAKRPTVAMTLSKPFERRGLISLFDDALFFQQDGVYYYGPAASVPDYLALIGSPCPPNVHFTDHIFTVTNAVAKYEECPVKKAVDEVVSRFVPQKQELESPPPYANRSKSVFGKKKKKDEEIPFELLPRQKQLAIRLEEERRAQAANEKKEEKLAVWAKLAEIEAMQTSNQPKSEPIRAFEHMILEARDESQKHKPVCFMNIECFSNVEYSLEVLSSQPPCSFASEGSILGVIGPSNSSTNNLILSLQSSSAISTTMSEIRVCDIQALSEFLKVRQGGGQVLIGTEVEELAASMMLVQCQSQKIGTLIQRGTERGSKDSLVELGEKKMFSTAVRSILVLDKVHELDAQSFFVILKYIKRIAVGAKLAVVLLLKTPEEGVGLFPLLNNLLIYNEEGVAYFGVARHLEPYCTLVGFPRVDTSIHITEHFRNEMNKYAPSKFDPSDNNIQTPFTVRYQYSALSKYYKGIIDSATNKSSSEAPQSTRMAPKTTARTSRRTSADDSLEKLETLRQKQYRQELVQRFQQQEQQEQNLALEKIWRKLTADERAARAKAPAALSLESVVQEMFVGAARPPLFLNIASFIENPAQRTDATLPLTGYALTGRILAVMGPPDIVDMPTFLAAFNGESSTTSRSVSQDAADPFSARSDLSDRNSSVKSENISVYDVVRMAVKAKGDVGDESQVREVLKKLELESVLGELIGILLQRESTEAIDTPSILVLDHLTDNLPAQASYAILKFIKKLAETAKLAVIVHTPNESQRRGLFPLFDDIYFFSLEGVAYFGPANRLREYLVFIDFTPAEAVHETDHLSYLLREFEQKSTVRARTQTSPIVRFRYSPLAHQATDVILRFRGTVDSGLATYRSPTTERPRSNTTFSLKTKASSLAMKISRAQGETKQQLVEQQAAAQRARIAEQEAEAERKRISELNAEAVWKSLSVDN